MKNSKWAPFLVRQNFFENWDGYSADTPCVVGKSFIDIADFIVLEQDSRYRDLKHVFQYRHFK